MGKASTSLLSLTLLTRRFATAAGAVLTNTDSAWSECSVTCGGGVQQRKLDCSQSNTKGCTGQTDTETRDCNTQDCPSKLKIIVLYSEKRTILNNLLFNKVYESIAKKGTAKRKGNDFSMCAHITCMLIRYVKEVKLRIQKARNHLRSIIYLYRY